MYLDITLPQLIFLEFAFIFSYLMIGSLMSGILHHLTGEAIHVVGQIHITLLWPAHIAMLLWQLILLAVATVQVLINGPKEDE